MWQEPKIDWVSTDSFNFEDYNRIKNNIAYLREMALPFYSTVPFEDMGDDKNGYNEFPYAEEFNRLENNLELLRNSTFIFNNEEKKTWYANEKTPDFEDFNRIERICLDYYKGLQRYRPRRLSITLGMATTDLKI
ncbi:hypothetical protein NQ556_08840 [Coprococcus comes ATCC 27758]|uniref:Uncharacterized protein n=1 Tax=Coprococcus comes ATCC 27758 TaxID=470146 RepID=C0BA77_9FIRM|nr:hypothetical protein [Coprococcus comes]EEG89719.1 hypothetical protein COPCOM_02709 [Coprococcus comes ATCC 27758]QRT50196.1 hypothetical protein I6K69_02500 [Coprococcus comes]UWP12769.1 hypothetical protein NQ556_08840 [Coprococcus comes ATCC 27758]